MADQPPSSSPACVPLPGSERHLPAGARCVGSVPPEERFEVTVRVRAKAPLPAAGAHGHRPHLSREAFAEQHGADPADLQRVEDFARRNGLVVVDRSAARRSVFLSGTAEQFQKVFGTSIEHVEFDGGSYRGRTGPLLIPDELRGVVQGVFGIDDRPAARPHFQRHPAAPASAVRARQVTRSFTPPELAQLYEFPAGADGSGECIALIELGGGYRPADLKAYFQGLGLPAPKVVTVRVDGGRNAPSNADSADGEVMLDIEVAAGVAPKATIAVYFAPNTDKGFLDAITQAVHDTTHKPSVISISWGNPEKNWTAQSIQAFDETFQAAAALGVTVCCAAGDAGSGDENPSDSQPDGLAHADFPGSSPHVLCCGGTRLTASGGKISAETVWNDDAQRSATGGGISDVFDVPDYQAAADVPPSANPGGRRGRGVPDVAGNADPASGYQVRVDGETAVFGGTSAVAPLWAGLIARLNQQLGRPVGFLNPLLYGPLRGQGVTRDITSGSNGAYQAGPGWDACSGWGSPVGQKLLDALRAAGGAAAPSA
jgi:kumamolisin